MPPAIRRGATSSSMAAIRCSRPWEISGEPKMMKTFAAALAVVLMVATAASAQTKPAAKPAVAAPAAASPPGEDRYIGYYYPKPTSTELFESHMQPIAGIDRPQRIQFVTVVSQGTIQAAY